MLLALIGMGVSAWLGSGQVPAERLAGLLPPVTFNPSLRSVSNWRIEAATHLDPRGTTVLPLMLGRDPGAVTRCVRLNNYWCVKRAGWAGEIAADREDHVAFASALEGADVAALLLRRYYVAYGRHSARAIVSHWAPALCDGPSAPGAGVAAMRRARADGLTTHGLRNTLRARFLAGRGRRVAGRVRRPGRPSRIPDPLIGTRTVVPAIVAGADSASVALPPAPLAIADLSAGGWPASRAAPEPSCSSDAARLRAYAANVAAGVAPDGDADLALFDAKGLPTPHLAQVMENMSAVEIGPLRAGRALIAAALARVARLAESRGNP